jgi:biotin carboxyl carrier protein
MRYRFEHDGRVYEVDIETKDGDYTASIDGQAYACELLDTQPGQISLRFEGRPATVYYARQNGTLWLSMSGCTYRLEKAVPRAARAHAEHRETGAVRAPMPAQVRAVQVQTGEQVEKGQTLLLLEAMKMEIRVRAPGNGRVAKVLVKPGQTVEKEQALVELEE